MNKRRLILSLTFLFGITPMRVSASCWWPSRVRAEVGISIATTTGYVNGPGYAEIVNSNNEICSAWMVEGTVQVYQDDVSIVASESGASPGSLVVTARGPASPGHCYSSAMVVSTSYEGASASGGPQCWYGPPNPPQDPVDPGDPNGGCDGDCSPILINLEDGPWRLSGPADPVHFDINADGRRDRITWTRRGEPLAFLALDRNGNGTIDNGAELFGTATPLMAGGTAPNGFEALEEFDLDGDGWVDGSDAVWGRLLLWTDADHDGVSQTHEIKGIRHSPIAALRTAYHETRRVDPAGNSFQYMSRLRLDRGERPYYDVFFKVVE